MADYELSEEAKTDFDGIAQYSEYVFGRARAEEYGREIIRAIELTVLFPRSRPEYTTRDGRTYRRCDSGRHTAFYRIEEENIFVVRILHQSMDFDRHL